MVCHTAAMAAAAVQFCQQLVPSVEVLMLIETENTFKAAAVPSDTELLTSCHC
jgi:hypothetical protein